MTAQPRGTSNGNATGSAANRRRRKVRLVEAWRADVDIVTYDEWTDLIAALIRDEAVDTYLNGPQLWVQSSGTPEGHVAVVRGLGQPTCRCYRCGRLLTRETATADRVKPGAEGGTYAFENLRPACCSCNSITGNEYRWAKERAEKARRARSAERARDRRKQAAL